MTAHALQWFRGQLHTHSYWSDGRGFPDEVVAIYKQRGYSFLALTDHNRFAIDQANWQQVVEKEGAWPPKISRERFEAYRQMFGDGWVERRAEGDATFVRLKTYADLKERFEETGQFLLIPGVESTVVLGGIHLHMNYLNLPTLIPYNQGANLVKKAVEPTNINTLINQHVQEVNQTTKQLGRPSMLMLNHPFIFFCDISAQNLIDCPDVRFFEICNNGSEFPACEEAPNYTAEQFWDAVNAFRCSRGQQLLLGVGSDDAHYYDPARINGESGVEDSWIMVRTTELTVESLFEAMNKSEFYATCGVLLDDVTFNPIDQTLHVKVSAEPAVGYRIEFITTKRGFDPSVGYVTSASTNRRPVRTLPIYSDDIGRTVLSVEGTQASYRMAEDDLYVRARVVSDKACRNTPHFHPRVQTAWTQPYRS